MNVPEPRSLVINLERRSCKRSSYTAAVTVVECLVNVEDVERENRLHFPM